MSAWVKSLTVKVDSWCDEVSSSPGDSRVSYQSILLTGR